MRRKTHEDSGEGFTEYWICIYENSQVPSKINSFSQLKLDSSFFGSLDINELLLAIGIPKYKEVIRWDPTELEQDLSSYLLNDMFL